MYHLFDTHRDAGPRALAAPLDTLAPEGLHTATFGVG